MVVSTPPAGTGNSPDYSANTRLHGKRDSTMAKAKKANQKAARPAKKAAPRKAAKKVPAKPKKKVAVTKAVKKPPRKPAARRRTAKAPAPAPSAVAAPVIVSQPAPTPAAVAPVTTVAKVPSIPLPPATPESALDHDPTAARKKGVRKATITSGLQDTAGARRLGRSRIPVDAPLDVVFQNDTQAREAFSFLGIHSIRELEAFTADDLVLRLTGPAKLTVGRIRKILAMNNRCLTGDEDFAVEFQELHTKTRPE